MKRASPGLHLFATQLKHLVVLEAVEEEAEKRVYHLFAMNVVRNVRAVLAASLGLSEGKALRSIVNSS